VVALLSEGQDDVVNFVGGQEVVEFFVEFLHGVLIDEVLEMITKFGTVDFFLNCSFSFTMAIAKKSSGSSDAGGTVYNRRTREARIGTNRSVNIE